GQGLPNGEVIFRSQQIEAEGENNEGDGSEGQIQGCDPLLKRNFQLQIYFCDPGQRFTKNDGVKANQNGEAKPKKQEKGDDIFRPPVPVFDHAVSMTEGPRDCADKHGAEINPGDDSHIRNPSARAGYNHAGERG